MAIPEAGRGAILDAQRLLAFTFDTPVNVLIFYDKQGAEVGRVDHWWSASMPRGRGRNFDEDRIKIVEDGTQLDTVLAIAETLRYQVETVPTPTLSDPYQLTVADRPQPGRNREWGLVLTQPKFKKRHFGPGTR
jgi:hypothetical protein